MSRMIDRNKRDMQPLEGAGGGASGGGRRGGLSRTEGAALAAPVVATGIGGIAAERRRDAVERDKAITRTETMRREAAKPRTRTEDLQNMRERAGKLQRDVSTRHYKGMANSTKQK